MNNSQLAIVNNTAADLSPVYALIVDFAHTGEIHDDIADLFFLELVEYPNTERPYRVIVEFA